MTDLPASSIVNRILTRPQEAERLGEAYAAGHKLGSERSLGALPEVREIRRSLSGSVIDAFEAGYLNGRCSR